MTYTYTLEVISSEWAGTLHDGWRPAIDGSLNNTSDDAMEASTFHSLQQARKFWPIVLGETPSVARIRRSDGEILDFYEEEESEDEKSS